MAAKYAVPGSVEDGMWPRPACPNCQSGYIAFAEPTQNESRWSIEARDHLAFDPDWVRGTFAVRGQCENLVA